jgi:hypothetical protein
MSVKNSNDSIGNKTREFPACIAVPQTTVPQRICVICDQIKIIVMRVSNGRLNVSRKKIYLSKIKFTLEQATKFQTGSRGTLMVFFNIGTTWGGWTTTSHDGFTIGKETRYLLYRRLGQTQDRSVRVRKTSSTL